MKGTATLDAPSAGARERPLDFEALVVREQAALLPLARRLVWDAEEARDLVQSALADAYEKRASLRDVRTSGA